MAGLARAVLPFPLTIGTDICHIPRIHRILQHSDRRRLQFIHRLLNATETARPHLREPVARILRDQQRAAAARALLEEPQGGRKPPRAPDLWSAACFLAGRFAAKEAVIKAHHGRGLTFHDITITTGAAAAPRMNGAGPGGREGGGEGRPAERAGGVSNNGSGPPLATVVLGGVPREVMVSISHDGDYATAVCLGTAVD